MQGIHKINQYTLINQEQVTEALLSIVHITQQEVQMYMAQLQEDHIQAVFMDIGHLEFLKIAQREVQENTLMVIYVQMQTTVDVLVETTGLRSMSTGIAK